MSDDTAPSLEAYKKSARRLRKAFARHDPDALVRVTTHINVENPLKHADFLHVVAREAGHGSWPQLKFSLENAAMSFAEKAERLKRALYFGQHWVTKRLLAGSPGLKDANLGLQIALLDLEAVRAAVAVNPGLATEKVVNRSPIVHLAFSQEIHRSPEKQSHMLAIADLLVANGALINDGYCPEPDGKYKLSALYGAMCHANNFVLGNWFLEQGADPNDDESLYHATELSDTKALEALLRHGARPEGTNALPRALDFDNTKMVRLLLEAGADPNVTEPDHPSGMPMNTIPALHQAARRGASVEVVTLLMEHGADPAALWGGHSAYAMAMIFGNISMAECLASRRKETVLSQNENILAKCALGNSDSGSLDERQLSEEDRKLLTRLAFVPGTLPHLRALVEVGLDPDEVDEMGLPPLHVAGWNGLCDHLKFFLSFKPDLTRKNGYGGDALDTVLHGSEFAPKRPEADHLECARMLLEAGSQIYPDFIAGCGNEDMVDFLEAWIEQHPEALTDRF